MIMEKIKTDKIIVVEGKYDKNKLSSIVDAHIITTDGFSLFNNKEKRMLLKKLSEKYGVIILTDSDGAGFVIRNKLKGFLSNNCEIINLYAPRILGKESRKNKPSKEGYLGVEGIDASELREIFEKYGVSSDSRVVTSCYTKTDLYDLGYSGKDDSSAKRDKISSLNGLPTGMSANAFLEAVNMLGIILE